MIEIGRGVASWPRAERISDRYGLVGLTATPDGVGWVPLPADLPLGRRGRLIATVLETRRSPHIGDLFRGIVPSTPSVGDVIVLGTGDLFQCRDSDGECVGLNPSDGRKSDWLDPHALYRIHEQTVLLAFEPAEPPDGSSDG